MQPIDLQQVFLESTTEVLETMFFTTVTPEPPEEPAHEFVAAELTFRGSPSGRFGIRIPTVTARPMTANFLGLQESEVSPSQIEEVTCELTNIICGSVLSRVEANGRFELLHPEISPVAWDWRQSEEAFGCTFSLDEGSLTVWVAIESPALRRN